MTYTYAVIGAGRQGTAAAYDMARWGDAERVILADKDFQVAQAASRRVNDLLGKPLSEAASVDVTDLPSVERLLDGVDSFLSAVPYYYNLELSRIAIQVKAHMCDLGGNTTIVRQQHALDTEARQAGISLLPDCGQVPGMGTSLMVYAMEMLDEPQDVYMWDGGLPQDPHPPFNYMLTFHIAGLTNEYAEPGIFLRDGEIVEVEPMTELEQVEFPGVGDLEAFVTGGGTSTMPWTYQGKLRTLQNLTLRYPGHLAHLRAFYDLGLWDLQPVQVGDVTVRPRDLFHALYAPKVTFPGEKDIVFVRVKALGRKNGLKAEASVDLVDRFDETTGFTAMERTTGWSAAIVAQMMARGQTTPGSGGLESFVPAGQFVEELCRRGFNFSERLIQAVE